MVIMNYKTKWNQRLLSGLLILLCGIISGDLCMFLFSNSQYIVVNVSCCSFDALIMLVQHQEGGLASDKPCSDSFRTVSTFGDRPNLE